MHRRVCPWVVLLAASTLLIDSVSACTGVILRTDDQSTISARTMEFGADVLLFELTVVPTGQRYVGLTPSGVKGLEWTTKYGHVGFSPFGQSLIADGLNEEGLSCGAFYLPGYAEYQPADESDNAHTISNMDLVSWVLGNFATVAEVRDALSKVRVTGIKFAQLDGVAPLHYRVVDAEGNNLVVEYTGGELHLFEAPLRVITNSPTYDWHETNARNYLGLQSLNRPAVDIDGQKLAALGQGSGAIGLPGDFTPPSRFIRAAFFVQTVYPGKLAENGVDAAFHILDQFDIPRGAVREREGDRVINEVTQWTSAADHKNRRYYFHTEQNRRVRVLELANLNLKSGRIQTLAVDGTDDFQDLTADLNRANSTTVSGPLPAASN